jgi:predicted Fe-S protein YdhL (DUF1289 family)
MSSPASKQSERTRHSPCVGICQIEQATGWCLGCGRTGTEIGRWLGMSEDERLALWSELPRRLDQLAVHTRLLPWTFAELQGWVRSTLEEGRGTWVVGVPGAVAEFPCGAACALKVGCTDEHIEARASAAQFRLRLNDKVRAFSFAGGGPIVLGLPKARSTLPVAKSLTALGADVDAIDGAHRGHEMFDFGVGRQSARFCVRTGKADLIATMRALAGQPWARVLQDAGAQILAESPHRVVESALARIEVFAPIPAPGDVSPDGAQTHFLPSFLQSADETPAGLALPIYAQQVAIYYPAANTVWGVHPS